MGLSPDQFFNKSIVFPIANIVDFLIFEIGIRFPHNIINTMLLLMVSLSVVVLIRIVGIILVIALLTIPAAICRQFTYNIKTLIMGSIATGMLLTLGGLWISYMLDLASGATIILVLTAVFVL